MSGKFHTSSPKPSSRPARFRIWAVLGGTAAVATAGLLVPSAANAAQARTARYPGAAAASVRPQADKATQVHMQFVNNTGQALILVSAAHGGTGVHWENQAPQTLAMGATGSASAYSAGDTSVTLLYEGVSDGAQFTLGGVTNFASGNTSSGTSTSASYSVPHSIGSGYNPTASFSIQPGGTFSYTGSTTTYTVPAGITQLKLEAIGGGTFGTGTVKRGTGGADVTGTVSVTPGEQLTLGVGGRGGSGGTNYPDPYAGGWGMSINGDNYSGGNTNVGPDNLASQPGGGATVVTGSSSGSIIVVAGGGGGNGVKNTDCEADWGGGDGGAGGSWTGGNGQPFPGGGGQAGANTTTQGQSTPDGADCEPGAGGGGVKGGLAGVDGGGAGGGAGSSAAPGLTGATVTANIPGTNAAGSQGEVIISPATSHQVSR